VKAFYTGMKSEQITIINISISELKAIIKEAIESQIVSLNERDCIDNEKLLLTRKDVAQLLNISLPTLTKYVKKGLVPAHRLGSRILFNKIEVLNSMNKVQKNDLLNLNI